MDDDYISTLKQRAEDTGSIVCMGMDPVLEKIPFPVEQKKKDPAKAIESFYLEILEAMRSEDAYPAIAKPNIAFYEQYGFPGLRALKNIIDAYKKAGIPVIMDAKRADIGKTSEAYAKAMFDFWNVDALTVAPYMGLDSVQPFIEYCKRGKGVYILCRTSNKGAVDLQNQTVGGAPLYMKVAENIMGGWHQPGVGAVVGATYPKEMQEIALFFAKAKKDIPFLIPGVGAQGGSASEVIGALKAAGSSIGIHRVNSSSGINFAYIEEKTDDFAGAAVRAIRKLDDEINSAR